MVIFTCLWFSELNFRPFPGLSLLALFSFLSVGHTNEKMISFQRIDCEKAKSIKVIAFPKTGSFEATGKAHHVLDVFLRNDYFVENSADIIRVFEGDLTGVCLSLQASINSPVSSQEVINKFSSSVGCRFDSINTRVPAKLFVHHSIIERRKRIKHLKYSINLTYLAPEKTTAIFVIGLAESPEMWEKSLVFQGLETPDKKDIKRLIEKFEENGFSLEEKTMLIKDLYPRMTG